MSSSEWTILEKLLLSQAVYKYGEDNWFQVARNLKHHALLDRSSDYFNQKNCSHQYYSMVQELNKEKKSAESNDMPVVVQLARQLYTLRLDELKKAINEDEEKFLTLVAEIDDIRAGKWDNQLLGLSTTTSETTSSLKDAEATLTPTTTEQDPETLHIDTPTSDKQQSPSLRSDTALEELTKQEIEAEEAAKVETENVQNETRDVRKDDLPPITVEEQQKDTTQTDEGITPTTPANQDATTPNTEEMEPSAASNNEQTFPAASTSTSPSPSPSPSASPSPTASALDRSDVEDKRDTASLKRHLIENEDVNASKSKRQKTENQPPFLAESVSEKLEKDLEIDEDEYKRSKKSRIDDNEPLAIDTNRTDYSTDVSRGTTPADLLEGTESVAGSESNAATPTHERQRRRDDQRNKSWLKNINLLWREIANHKNGAMFMNPIKENIAPHYYEIVKRPMDLKAIKNRIRDGIINTTTEFERDVVLMLNNSLMYNKEGTEVYQLAKEMLDDAVEQIKIFKLADTDTTASSHTRAATKKSTVPE